MSVSFLMTDRGPSVLLVVSLTIHTRTLSVSKFSLLINGICDSGCFWSEYILICRKGRSKETTIKCQNDRTAWVPTNWTKPLQCWGSPEAQIRVNLTVDLSSTLSYEVKLSLQRVKSLHKERILLLVLNVWRSLVAMGPFFSLHQATYRSVSQRRTTHWIKNRERDCSPYAF